MKPQKLRPRLETPNQRIQCTAETCESYESYLMFIYSLFRELSGIGLKSCAEFEYRFLETTSYPAGLNV